MAEVMDYIIVPVEIAIAKETTNFYMMRMAWSNFEMLDLGWILTINMGRDSYFMAQFGQTHRKLIYQFLNTYIPALSVVGKVYWADE